MPPQVYHYSKGLIDHQQSVRRLGNLVLKTIVSGSEKKRQNHLKNHENNKKKLKKLAKFIEITTSSPVCYYSDFW